MDTATGQNVTNYDRRQTKTDRHGHRPTDDRHHSRDRRPHVQASTSTRVTLFCRRRQPPIPSVFLSVRRSTPMPRPPYLRRKVDRGRSWPVRADRDTFAAAVDDRAPTSRLRRHVHATVLVLRSRHRWFDSQRRLHCRSPFWSAYWCDAKLSVCGHLWTTGKNAPIRAYRAPTARLRDTAEDVMTDDCVPRSSQEVDRCVTRRRDPQAEGRRRRRRASSRHVRVQGDQTRR